LAGAGNEEGPPAISIAEVERGRFVLHSCSESCLQGGTSRTAKISRDLTFFSPFRLRCNGPCGALSGQSRRCRLRVGRERKAQTSIDVVVVVDLRL
jgi:hypothetical protein